MATVGGDGAGGWFCLTLGHESDGRVFHWSAIDGEARPLADDLRTLWLGWLEGTIST